MSTINTGELFQPNLSWESIPTKTIRQNMRADENQDATHAIQEFQHERLGRAITLTNNGKETVIGYVLPLSEKKHVIVLTNGKMYAVEPSFETYSHVYKRTFSPSELSIVLGEWATSVDKASEYITHNDFWKVVLANDKVDDLPELYTLMDKAVKTAKKAKNQKAHAQKESVQHLAFLTKEAAESLIQTETKSRFSTIVKKFREKARGLMSMNPEELPDHLYSEEELLQLVTDAQDQEAKILAYKYGDALTPSDKEETKPGDKSEIAPPQEEDAITKELQLNEDQLLEWEVKAVGSDSDVKRKANKELDILWKERVGMLDRLYDAQSVRRSYPNSIQLALILIDRFIAQPLERILMKAWKSLNEPVNSPLSQLRYAVFVKEAKAGLSEKERRSWRRKTGPVALANRIRQLQSPAAA